MISLLHRKAEKSILTNCFIAFFLIFIPILCILNSANELQAEEPDPSSYGQCQNFQGTWTGQINLVNYGSQHVEAIIFQNECHLSIKTSSTLSYGQDFSGDVTQGDYLTVIDEKTGETWTTHYSRARFEGIKLYDYVNNLSDLDELAIIRIPASE